MKKKNPQYKAHEFRKRLTQKTAVQKKLDAEGESEKFTFQDFKDYFHRSLIEQTKPVKDGWAEFLCNKASLQNELKEAEAMVLNKSEAAAILDEAHQVKISIKN